MVKPWILIVDDQHDIRRVLRTGLETLGRGFNIIDVPSGEEALLVLKQKPIDLLVADIRLPGISGLELKERALQHNPNLKLVLMTGLVDPTMKREVSAAGAEAVFYKPIELVDFLETIQVCLFGGIETTPAFRSDPAPEPPPVTRRSRRAKVEPELPGLRFTARENYPKTRASPSEPVLQVEREGGSRSPVQVPPPPHQPGSTPDPATRLAELRYEVDAVAVILLDANGRVALQTGNHREISDDRSLMFALKVALEGGAKVSRHLGAKNLQGFQYFTGRQYDLYLAQLGERGALALLVRGKAGVSQIPHIVEAVGLVSPDLAGFMDTLPQVEGAKETEPPAPPSPSPGEAPDLTSGLPELDLVFNSQGTNGFKAEEVDAFWDNLAAGSDNQEAGDRNALSYEEARKLGLSFPDEAG